MMTAQSQKRLLIKAWSFSSSERTRISKSHVGNNRKILRSLTSDSPMGLFAPGFKTLGDHFRDMWNDAEANREKWGCEYLDVHGTALSLIDDRSWKSDHYADGYCRRQCSREHQLLEIHRALACICSWPDSSSWLGLVGCTEQEVSSYWHHA